MPRGLLVMNAGSSSLKSSLFDLEAFQRGKAELLWEGKIEWGGVGEPPRLMEIADAKGAAQQLKAPFKSKEQSLSHLLGTIFQGEASCLKHSEEIALVAHRVVHGGDAFLEPVLISQKVKDKIRDLFPLAPLHNPANLEGIEMTEKAFPKALQAAVFDTAFFGTMPEHIATYPIPLRWREEGVRRFGFHGISHEYCSEALRALFPQEGLGKMITCHIGAGVSVTAIDGGKAFATSMGFTPIEGAMMGKRSGSIDPGIILYLMREKHLSLAEVERMIQFESGLLGIAGTADFRDLLAREEQDDRARLAYRMFIHRIAKEVGAMAAALGGVDLIAFTGGIGEKSPQARRDILERVAFMGFDLDREQNENRTGDRVITKLSSKKGAAVVYCREDLQIARKSLAFAPR